MNEEKSTTLQPYPTSGDSDRTISELTGLYPILNDYTYSPVPTTTPNTWYTTEPVGYGPEVDSLEIRLREKAIEATCKAFGTKETTLQEFSDLLDKFYNYLKFGTKINSIN